MGCECACTVCTRTVPARAPCACGVSGVPGVSPLWSLHACTVCVCAVHVRVQPVCVHSVIRVRTAYPCVHSAVCKLSVGVHVSWRTASRKAEAQPETGSAGAEKRGGNSGMGGCNTGELAPSGSPPC